eukprot:CAMPEP_0172734260 /NCGR_PEP_ID=MMETSP1074-20121228/109450_1 /TAXON_ID=2916 /ORGANISM="Ceratium fusus, Strain PA161109" /LENGTH=50 /DNA_ID=CAMNT_0013562993 /DNA_START=352 /DNA_END=501 /DNA_ORIENTATION=-
MAMVDHDTDAPPDETLELRGDTLFQSAPTVDRFGRNVSADVCKGTPVCEA